MKILVAVKRVVDYNVKVRLNEAGVPETSTVNSAEYPPPTIMDLGFDSTANSE